MNKLENYPIVFLVGVLVGFVAIIVLNRKDVETAKKTASYHENFVRVQNYKQGFLDGMSLMYNEVNFDGTNKLVNSSNIVDALNAIK